MGKKVYVRDIALCVVNAGVPAAVEKYGMTPRMAVKVAKALRDADIRVPEALTTLADQVRDYGHKQPPPVAGDERVYQATSNARTSVNVGAIGIKGHQPVLVRYERDQIVVTKPSARRARK